VGDIHWVEKAQRRMKSLINRSSILILVSHQMDIIEKYCNRCIWMRGGRVAMDGPPKDVIAAYRASASTAVGSETKQVRDDAPKA
jgi:ABC-type polysaccharide/polyol phosphate transport system ATPase subunit